MPANNQPAFRPDLSRRPEASATMASLSRRSDSGAEDMRKLVVGPGIAFNGEISACDYLVVEGTVEARVKEGRRLEIADGGLFRGSVEIDEAEIAGKFEGDLTVRGRLSLRGTGRIEGKLQYGELSVEAGGSIDGDIKRVTAAPIAQPKARITGMNEILGEQPAASSAA